MANQLFQINDNQTGTLVVTAVDGANPPVAQPLPADVAASSSNSSVLAVAPLAGSPGSFTVTVPTPVGDTPATETITVTGTNAAGQQISTGFDFQISHAGPADVAVGFTGTFTINPS